MYSLLQPLNLSVRYSHPLDKTIIFKSPKKWYVRWYMKHSGNDESLEHVSVTRFVQLYAYFFIKQHYPIEEYQYGKHDEDIVVRTTLNSVRQAGIDLHENIQWYFNGHTDKSPCSSFDMWWVSFQKRYPTLKPLRTEMILRSDANTRLLGTADMLFYDTLSSPDCLYIHLVDWKRTNNVHKNMNLAMLQINMYKYLLELYYNGWTFDGCSYAKVIVSNMSLIIFSEGLTSVTEFCVHDEISCINMMINKHKTSEKKKKN
jgi:hypothetical protein